MLNLMGQSKNPLHLSGRAIDEENILKEAIDNDQKSVVSAIYLKRGWLAYLFDDYKLALKMIISLDLGSSKQECQGQICCIETLEK
eukprot:690160-Ditylum_brightwellii.AAC.1